MGYAQGDPVPTKHEQGLLMIARLMAPLDPNMQKALLGLDLATGQAKKNADGTIEWPKP